MSERRKTVTPIDLTNLIAQANSSSSSEEEGIIKYVHVKYDSIKDGRTMNHADAKVAAKLEKLRKRLSTKKSMVYITESDLVKVSAVESNEIHYKLQPIIEIKNGKSSRLSPKHDSMIKTSPKSGTSDETSEERSDGRSRRNRGMSHSDSDVLKSARDKISRPKHSSESSITLEERGIVVEDKNVRFGEPSILAEGRNVKFITENVWSYDEAKKECCNSVAASKDCVAEVGQPDSKSSPKRVLVSKILKINGEFHNIKYNVNNSDGLHSTFIIKNTNDAIECCGIHEIDKKILSNEQYKILNSACGDCKMEIYTSIQFNSFIVPTIIFSSGHYTILRFLENFDMISDRIIY
jgi:hypothetical protein